MANERLIFLACNIYSVLAEYSLHTVHSGEHCGPWASGYLVLVTGFTGTESLNGELGRNESHLRIDKLFLLALLQFLLVNASK